MQKTIPFSFLVVLILVMAGVKSFGQEVVQLFDGLSLNGWYTFLQHRGRDNDPKGV